VFEKLEVIPPGEAFDGAMQMALDEVLLHSIGSPTLRIYRWAAPCVTFGYFQKIGEVLKAYPGVPVTRRWTGGGMVEHGVDLTFSLMVPKTEPSAARPPAIFYRELHGCLASWIVSKSSSRLAGSIRLAGEGDQLSGSSCFTAPARDDLLLEGNKILGGAQRRNRGCLLYQGSLQGNLCGVQSHGFFDPVIMAGYLSASVSGASLAGSVIEAASELAAVRYRSHQWNGRR